MALFGLLPIWPGPAAAAPVAVQLSGTAASYVWTPVGTGTTAAATAGLSAVATATVVLAVVVQVALYINDAATNTQEANTANNFAVQNVSVGQSGTSSYHAATPYAPNPIQQQTFEPRKHKTPDFGGCSHWENPIEEYQIDELDDKKPKKPKKKKPIVNTKPDYRSVKVNYTIVKGKGTKIHGAYANPFAIMGDVSIRITVSRGRDGLWVLLKTVYFPRGLFLVFFEKRQLVKTAKIQPCGKAG